MAFPSVEQLLVEWAKANAPLNGLLNGRVATRLPGDPTFPFLTLFRVAGGPEDFALPVDQALVQWDSYAQSTNRQTPDFATAEQIALTLIDEARKESNANVALTAGWLYGMTVIDLRRVNEPDLRLGHYQVDTLVTIRETA